MKTVWKEASVFLAATFGVSWLFWLGAYLLSGWYLSPRQLLLLGTAAPSVFGLVFSRVFGGRAQLKALLRSLVSFRAALRYWLYAALLFPAILLCAAAVYLLAGGGLPPSQFPPWFLPIAFLYICFCMGPLGEELGWRGFLLKRLLPGWGAARAGLVLGLIWSAWHLPLFFIPGTIQQELTSLGVLPSMTGYLFYTCCISLLITLLYAKTGGNLLLCTVFHTVCNLSLGLLPIILTKGGAVVLLATLALATALILRSAGKHRSYPVDGPVRQPGTEEHHLRHF